MRKNKKEEEPRAIKMARELQKEKRESRQMDVNPAKVTKEKKRYTQGQLDMSFSESMGWAELMSISKLKSHIN
jgi:hypothetical protein